MKRRSFHIAALLVCAFVFGVSAWAAREVPSGPQDLEQLRADLAILRETVQRQLVESPPNVPVGTILAYAGPANAPQNLPEGWRVCNGAELSRTEFETLFRKIDVSWGKGNGTSTFNLPDLEGRFLRGVAGASQRDADVGTRTASRPGGNVNNAVGSVQEDAIQQHRHDNVGHNHDYFDKWQRDERSDDADDRDVAHFLETDGEHRRTSTETITITGVLDARTSAETRVKNAYVYWIIRVK